MTRWAGCQKVTTELSLRNSQSLSHLRYLTDIRQLTSPQGEADGVFDGAMTLQALGGVNSPCDRYRVRGQPLSTGGQEHTHICDVYKGKKGLQILMFTTFSSIQQSKVISLTSKNSGNKMENGYWQR